MKNSDVEEFPISFNTNNTFICYGQEDMRVTAMRELSKLGAENNTVYITDPYLFVSHNDTNYESDLLVILQGLKAKEIHYCVATMRGHALYERIQQQLLVQRCVLSVERLSTDCHDRFWLCAETDKAVDFGTSLNGLGKRVCRVDELRNKEVADLKQVLRSGGLTI